MNQADFFPELPSVANPGSDFGQVRVVEQNKILHYPRSFWKDGRMRADLSAYGAGEVVSRNEKNFREEVIRRLQEKFNTAIVEVVSDVAEELERDRARPNKQRLRKKDLQALEFVYANPYVEDKSPFGKLPDWLLARDDLKDIEKLILGRLLFPRPPICKSWNKDLGIITRLNQGELAKALAKSRPTINKWLISLQANKWIKCDGPPGAKQTIRFLWKDGMPETWRTCSHARQVSVGPPVAHADSSCSTSRQQPVTHANSACNTCAQVSLAVETNRETKKTQRRLLAPDGEQRLLKEIGSVVGAEEIKKNGGMWRTRIRGGGNNIKALRYTIEDYRVKTPQQKSAVKNPAAWFTDHYVRKVVEIEQVEAKKAEAN
ncbi:MAG: hypothetical protein WA183_06350 [Chthoniobacterales bacterium]